MDPLHMKVISDHTKPATSEADDAFYAAHCCAWLQVIKRITLWSRRTPGIDGRGKHKQRLVRIRNA